MKNRRVSINSGETMVEIMVSAVIFLMMMAVMQGAISFCSNAQAKSVQIRETNAKICRELETTSYVIDGGKATYSFNAVSADGNTTSIEKLFNVEVELGKKEVTIDGNTTTFYMFGVPDPDKVVGGEGAGGGTP